MQEIERSLNNYNYKIKNSSNTYIIEILERISNIEDKLNQYKIDISNNINGFESMKDVLNIWCNNVKNIKNHPNNQNTKLNEINKLKLINNSIKSNECKTPIKKLTNSKNDSLISEYRLLSTQTKYTADSEKSYKSKFSIKENCSYEEFSKKFYQKKNNNLNFLEIQGLIN